MQPTVKTMRQGSRLLLGKYSVDKNAEPVPVSWTKATPNGDFIASSAVDFLCFDAREPVIHANGAMTRNAGNPRYVLSNIHRFLNSEEVDWYIPAHEQDHAPSNRYSDIYGGFGTYTDHYGFLHYFEDFEIACLSLQTVHIGEDEVTSLIRLPTINDITGDSKFNLFKKKGIRVHPSEDIVQWKRNTGYSRTEQFMPYFLADKRLPESVNVVDRSGYVSHTQPCTPNGIRPICKIKLDARVEEIGSGVYELLPFDAVPMEAVSSKELFEFLGLV